MLSFRSIRTEFAFKLIPAFGILVFLFSYFVFTLIEYKIYEDVETELDKIAEIIIIQEDLTDSLHEKRYEISYKPDFEIYTEIDKNIKDYKTNYIVGKDRHYMEVYYPIIPEKNYFIIVKKDITDIEALLSNIKKIIIFMNVLAIGVIGIFSYLLSAILARPIKQLTKELSQMDERSLSRVNRSLVPEEFKTLAKSINVLINKIEGHINYQKELFIGLAHELKTPLAVIKTKNSVALMKERTPEKYIEVLKNNNKTVDEMNRMTSSILDIGRAEYAQFEPLKRLDVSKFLIDKARDYEILANNQGVKFINKVKPYEIECSCVETLLNHVIQNFIQNAIKFTPNGKSITVQTEYKEEKYIVEVIDEGCGIDEDIDPFAPFIRKGQKQGVGLGLFLAKNAATAMGAEVNIKNREDQNGAVATLVLDCVDK